MIDQKKRKPCKAYDTLLQGIENKLLTNYKYYVMQ